MVSSPIISSQPASPSYSPVESISESPAKRFRCDDLSFLDRFKECNGFKPQFHSNIFLNFPTQYLVFLKNRQWKVNLENESFHSIQCYNNKYLLSKDKEDVCYPCQHLEFNNELKEIIKRSKINYISKINHHLLSYHQLKASLDHKSDQINELRTGSLNVNRNYLNLLNRASDYKRLINLISLNDVPRIKQLISSCIKSKVSVSSMIEKLQLAITGNFF
jgi:hypothetical protein